MECAGYVGITTVIDSPALGYCPIPTHNTVVSIIKDLKSVLFPGYRRRDSLRLSDLIRPGLVILRVGWIRNGFHGEHFDDQVLGLIGRDAKSLDCQGANFVLLN